MLTLLLTGIAGLIIISAFLIIVNNRPDIWFWLFLSLYFDPGGYVGGYLDGMLLGPLVVNDVLIVGIIICMIAAKFNWRVIFADQFFIKFLFFLLLFAIYYFIVYGGLTPYFHNDFDYPRFLIKNRYYLYGIIIFISVYFFTIKGLKYFYLITLSIGIICLSLYLITLVTGIELAPIWELQREGTEMTRLIMLSYGLFLMIWPIALTVFLLPKKMKVNINYRQWLYFGGILMVLTELLTLTRRTQIDIIGIVLITLIIIAYLFRIGNLNKALKIAIPILSVSVVLYLTLPDYAEYVIKTGEDTFLILTTGENIQGQREDRATGTGDLEISKEYIKNNLILGTGYTFWNFGEGYASSTRGANYARASDAAGEVPIYYLFFGFGIAGAVLMLPLYFMIGNLFFKLSKTIRDTLINYVNEPLTLIYSIYFLIIIASWFTIMFYSLSSQFLAYKLSETAVLIGLGFALYRKISLNTYAELK